MRKRFGIFMAGLLAFSLLVTACSGNKSEPKQDKPASDTQTTTPKDSTFYGAWPYDVPPKTNFNWYSATNLAMTGSPYNELMFSPLAMYYWADDKWEPMLATTWNVDNTTNTITVNLRKGAKWSDGSDFKAQDLVTSMTLGKGRAETVWRYVDKLTVKDDYTVEFHLSNPASIALRYVLKHQPQPTSVYGDYVKKLQPLFDQGKTAASDEVKAVMKELDAYRPADFVTSGPYKIDSKNITEAQMTLLRSTTSWAAGTVKFEKLVLYQGETAAITPLVLDKKIDFATHAFPPATEKQILDQGIRVVRYPFYSGPSLFFNNDVYPLNRPEVRRAMAYAINRDENGIVALSKSGVGVKYMTGFSDNLVKNWVTSDVQAKLNPYKYDLTKAENELKSIGFKKGADGVWVDDKGKPLAFELSVPSDFSDWSASADNAAQQLNKFGFKITVRGVPSSQHPGDINAGKFQIGYRLFGSSVPHPSFAYIADLITYNQGGQIASKEKPGQNLPLKIKWSGGEFDFDKAITESGAGMDTAKQKAVISQMAQVFNETLPIVPLFERYSNSPALESVHVKGWPADTDPIMVNGSSDNFVTLLIYTGKLQPK